MSDYEDLPYIVVERRSGGLGAFLWGAIIGAGVAMLYAPRSGQELRDGLRGGVDRARRSAEDAVRQVQDSVTGAVDDLRTQVNDRVDSARHAVEAGRDAARESRADMERRVREARAAYESRRGPTVAGGEEIAPELQAEEDEETGI